MKSENEFYKNENKEFKMNKRRNIRMLIGEMSMNEMKKNKKS
jgi:hypothetical protein